MRVLLLIIGLCLVTFTFSCTKENISIEDRDKLLEKAFSEIESSDELTIINGIKTINKYPTQEGLHKIILLWEKNISESVEKEVLNTLKKDEMFKKDPSLIEDIFNRNYKVNSSKENKLKLKRLLQCTDVEIKNKLINKINKDLADGH